jgi:hypothetical protein
VDSDVVDVRTEVAVASVDIFPDDELEGVVRLAEVLEDGLPADRVARGLEDVDLRLNEARVSDVPGRQEESELVAQPNPQHEHEAYWLPPSYSNAVPEAH